MSIETDQVFGSLPADLAFGPYASDTPGRLGMLASFTAPDGTPCRNGVLYPEGGEEGAKEALTIWARMRCAPDWSGATQ